MGSIELCANWDSKRLIVWSCGGEGADGLRAAVGEVSSDALLASAVAEGAIEVEVPAGGGEVERRRISALVLGAAEAVDFLTGVACGSNGDGMAVCGPSVGYWAKLARLVVKLIAAKQFVPRVDEVESAEGEDELAASWRVVVQDRGQLGWLERFAGAMPASCRAIVGNGAAAGVEAAHLVETFLNETADALIRRATADDPFFQRVHERAAVPTAAMEVRWLSALLRSGGGRFIEGGEYHERAAFVEQARAWLGQLDETQGAALRLCFILHEPDEPGEEAGSGNGEAVPGNELPGLSAEGEEVWTLTLHLQGFDGEGELIDASSLWQGGSAAAAPILGRTIARRRAALLSEIARAGEVFPAMQQLLAHAEPAELRMSTTEAWAFIRHWTPHLRENGFVVTLPDWTSLPDPEMGLRLMLSPTDDPESIFDVLEVPAPRAGGPRKGGSQIGEAIELSGGHFGLDSLMNFNWQVAVGDSRLSPGEFEKIVERNAPLVRHGGKWVHVDVEAARRAVEFVKKRAGGQMTLADAFRTAFTANKAETGLDIVGLSGTGWIERLLEQSPGETVQAIGQPGGFVGELRPYQLRGLHWLAFMDRLGLGACLADDMGLGKTIQLIALLLEERERGKKEDRTSNIQHPTSNVRREDSARVGPTLLFAPTSVVGNWLRELQRFAPSLAVLVHHGPERASGEKLTREASAADVVITSYSLASRDKEDLSRVSWRRIVLDEAQKIKNPAAAATNAIRALAGPAPRRIAMTGTPIENHLSELWSIMQVLNPGLLGSAADFREKFAVPIEKLGERGRAEQLRRMIRPFVLRRTKQDPVIAGDLPEKLEMKVFCNLTAEQAAMYERLVNDSLRQIDSASGIRRRGLILATLTRLKQICDHPALLEETTETLDQRSGKCERLVEMLEEVLEEGDAALVFTQYREMGHLLEKVVKARLKEPTFFLHGGTPAKGRDDMILKFQKQERGTPRIFLLSLRAGGLGLNLTAANHVFHFDRWWNPAVEAQATDRAHRVGQTKNVQVHKFVCIGTMEERIDRLLSEKQALADQIVGGGDEWLTGLSTDQLREYLTLSKEAVGEFERE